MYVLDPMKRKAVVFLLQIGLSLREVSSRTGVHKMTIHKIRHKEFGGYKPASASDHASALTCDNCGVRFINPQSEWFRKKPRTKHKFCHTSCYGEFCRRRRADDSCRRCGRLRKEKLCSSFSRGYCEKCYGLLRQYGFDETLASAHELNQQLKVETHEQEERERKEHGRPPKIADRDNRGRSVGNNRASAGTGDFKLVWQNSDVGTT